MSETIQEILEPFLDRVYRKSKSQKARESYLHAILIFSRWYGKDVIEVIEDLKKGRKDVYKTLDDYVTHLSKLNRAPNTIKTYLALIKKFLRFYEIEINNEKFKATVELPRIHTITQDRIPTIEEMKGILYSTNIRGKAMVSMLASSGMRIGELLSLRVKDIEFGVPSVIRLRAEVTKDRMARICFISDEATKFLKQYLGERINKPDNYVFQGRHQGVRTDGTLYQFGIFENEPISYWDAEAILINAVKKAGFSQRDDNRRRRIHLHVLRKFFFTQLIPVLGREITEALMGHRAFYDSAYRRFTESQLAEHYVNTMHAVTILESKPMKPTDIQIEVLRTLMKQQGLDPDEALKNTEGFREMNPEKQIEFFSQVLLGQRNYEEKVIKNKELERYIKNGWTYVDELSNGSVIVRKR